MDSQLETYLCAPAETVAKSSKSNVPRDLLASGPLAEVRDVVKVPETVLVFAGERTGLTWRRERRRFRGELLVKVTDVFFAADGRDEGRGQLLLQQRLPVHALEGETDKNKSKKSN